MKSDEIVTIPEVFVTASYYLSLTGERLKALLFSKIPVTGLNSVTVTAEEWKILFPDSENPYEDLIKAAKEMMHCKVQLKGESTKRLFLDSVKFDDKKERITLSLNRELFMEAFFNKKEKETRRTTMKFKAGGKPYEIHDRP